MDQEKSTQPQVESTSATNTPQKQQSQAKIQENFSFLYRIKLDVTINAPIIIVPQHSASSNAVLLDCGTITVKTAQEILNTYYQKEGLKISQQKLNDRVQIPPIYEVQKVVLANMEVLKVVLDEDLGIKSQLSLVDCSELKLVVKRNLQPNIFKNIESILVEAIYEGLKVSLSR